MAHVPACALKLQAPGRHLDNRLPQNAGEPWKACGEASSVHEHELVGQTDMGKYLANKRRYPDNRAAAIMHSYCMIAGQSSSRTRLLTRSSATPGVLAIPASTVRSIALTGT